jgi:Flp pilus assembly protein TadG
MIRATGTFTAVVSDTKPSPRELPARLSARTTARRKKFSGGNVIVECAFTLVPMFALILGFIDVGMMIYRWSTLQNAIREGCRYAITFQTSGGQGQDASIEQVVANYAMGIVKTTDSPNRIKVNYYLPTNMNTPIASGGNVPGNIVEVSVQGVPFSWIMPLSGTISSHLYATSPVTLNLYSLDMLGGYPVGVSSVAR